MDTIRVLVTGAGSGVGQAIVKALRICSLPVRIVSGDIDPMNAALYRADEALVIPKVEDPQALPEMIALLRENQIDVVMIGSEFDLVFFATHRDEIEKETNASVIVSSLKMVEIAKDKCLTADFLRKHELPYLASYRPTSLEDALRKADQWHFPIFLKPVDGTSSRNVHFLNDESELKAWFRLVPRPMIQEAAGIPSTSLDKEYTCSVFKCRDGQILGPTTIRRTLRGGQSWVIEMGHFQELYPILLRIAEKANFLGSLNVQLMLGDRGPVPFEFNCRFSGTTAVRAHFGFNEPELALRYCYLNEKCLETPTIRTGVAFRYFEEVFVDGVDIDDLTHPFPVGEIVSWF